MLKKTGILNVLTIVLSAFFQAYLIETVVQTSNLVPAGFTGLSVLLNMLLNKVDISISVSFFIVALNIPVAIFCARDISKKFTMLSLLQLSLTSLFLKLFKFTPILDSMFLKVVIGGFLYGLVIVLALRSEGSTGGTDFIALYVSNKIGKTIWEYIFILNAFIIIVFGYNKGWESSGYSVVFQFIVTVTISKFYLRYEKLTLQIITRKGEEVSKAYIENSLHGMTLTHGYGCYSGKEIDILYTVVSTYQIKDVVRLVKRVDPEAIINSFKTEDFYGPFVLR